ncbi:hypothetical protein QYE76_069423 [Lolium multiflorum]|uniref:Uncharacterized protein n=1 Tax=Lolium multiflorum TaxID=4521 RepID=A0AAD8WCX6_LOLMU|nr:hypothetical protein QYE76_069423 [Lolium multiflorum]
MAESSSANATVSGLKVSDILLPHPSLPNSLCLGPHSVESPAHLISCEANRIPFVNQNLDLTSWADCLRAWPNPPEDWVSWCYSFFDALAIPVPHNLSFTSSTDGFESWWPMWKTHAFRRALGPLLKQIDAEYDIPAEQQQDGPEPVHDDGSPFKFLPPAPVVLFCKSSPPLKKVVMQSQPISPKSASKSKVSSGPAAPRASIKARKAVRKVAARKTLKRQTPALAQESLHASTEGNSSEETHSSRGNSSSGHSVKITMQSQPDLKSGEVEEVLMPSATLDLATSKSVADKVANLAKPTAETQESITSSSAIPLVLGEGYDLSSLLAFDPESIEPATSRASEELGPSATHGQLQRLKALLSSSMETLVENPEEVKSILEDIQPHLPVMLQVKLWPVVTLSAYKARVKLARQRINLRHAQLRLKADIADKCQWLNEKKAALEAKTDTSVSTAELKTLRKELEDLEERVRATKQLIHDKEALIARSQEEAEGLKAQLKTELAEIRALNKAAGDGQGRR